METVLKNMGCRYKYAEQNYLVVAVPHQSVKAFKKLFKDDCFKVSTNKKLGYDFFHLVIK